MEAYDTSDYNERKVRFSYLLNSSFISSTFDGWQQMATEDWVGSNRGATYVRPTLIRSARVTWETLASKDLEDNDKTGFVLFWGPRILDFPWIFPWLFQVFQDLMFSRPDFCRSLRQASPLYFIFRAFFAPLSFSSDASDKGLLVYGGETGMKDSTRTCYSWGLHL